MMSDCEHYFNQIQELRTGHLDDEPSRHLFEHLARCGECRALFDLHTDLEAAGSEIAEPEAGEYAAMRRQVLAGIQPGRPFILRRPVLRYALAAAAVVMLVLTGFKLGQISVPGMKFAAGSEAGDEKALTREPAGSAGSNGLLHTIETASLEHRSFRDVEESTNLFSNVSLREAGAGRVRLSFDVTRHMDIVRPREDPLVHEVLVHALLDPSSVGSRLKAITYASGLTDLKVREALIFSMLNDSEYPVRQRALSVLAAGPTDSRLQEALLQVLEQDGSVQMRLKAIEALAGFDTDSGTLNKTLESSGVLADPAVAFQVRTLNEL